MWTSLILWTLVFMMLARHMAEARSDLSCNVMLTSWRDLKVKKFGKTGCMARVERAYKNCGSKTIGILPYQTFLYKWQQVQGKAIAFMSAIKFADERGGKGAGKGKLVLKDPNTQLVAGFQKGLEECLVHATKVGFTTIIITPHMNAPGNKLWRNWLAFSPFANYGGFTYKNTIINPIVAASKAAIAKGAKVRLALQGEMNMALAMYPKEWAALVKETKAALGGNTKVGVSMNWNKVCGEFCRYYPAGVFSQGQKDAYKSLLQSVDFIGLSNYPSVWNSYTKNTENMDYDVGFNQLDSELKEFIGFGLGWLATQKNPRTELQWSEFGIGGGCDDSAACTATSLQTMASATFAMVAGPYGRYRDPWTPKWAKDFRYKFHQQAIRILSGKKWSRYPVAHALVWSTGSMDVCNVDPDSTTKKGSFYSPSVCGMIYNYNAHGVVP